MILLLIGASCIVLGAVLFTIGLGAMDSGPEWVLSLAPIGSCLFFGGVAVFLIGLGVFFAHPHTFHI